MIEKIAEVKPPRGLRAIPWRLPIWLYRLQLGWLLGGRFLLLTHTGRKSGLPRRAVIEVIRHDPQSNTYYVVSGFGEKSQWFQNVMKTPETTIQVGQRKMTAIARRLPAEEAEREMLDYARRHPKAMHNLARIIGYRLGDAEEDYRAMGRIVPIVGLQVR